MGFSDDTEMPGSDAIIGLPGVGIAQEYDMPDRSTPDLAEDQVRSGRDGGCVRAGRVRGTSVRGR